MDTPTQRQPWQSAAILLAVTTAVALAAYLFLPAPSNARADDDRPRIVATFTVIGDWVDVVGGDRIDLHVLTPVGAEVHEWELRADNFIALEEADLVFANGLNLEQWMEQVEATVPSGTRIVRLANEVDYPAQPIRIGDFEGAADPHKWMDPRAAREQVRLIGEALAEIDPEHADTYRENAERYGAELKALHAELSERLDAVPEVRRTLITSEAAFLYFADTYGFHHDGIWGSNNEDEGTPQQVARIIDVIEERQPAAIFWESTISDRYVRSVSDDTDTPVVGPLYVDSLGEPDSGAESYIEMMRRNAELLVETLSK